VPQSPSPRPRRRATATAAAATVLLGGSAAAIPVGPLLSGPALTAPAARSVAATTAALSANWYESDAAARGRELRRGLAG
jgi:hypothetical protein